MYSIWQAPVSPSSDDEDFYSADEKITEEAVDEKRKTKSKAKAPKSKPKAEREVEKVETCGGLICFFCCAGCIYWCPGCWNFLCCRGSNTKKQEVAE